MNKLEELEKEIRKEFHDLLHVEVSRDSLFLDSCKGIDELDEIYTVKREPIQLHNILNWLGLMEGKEVFYSNEEFFGYLSYDKWYPLIDCEWKHKTLSDQSPDLIDYLHSLIKIT